MNSNTDNGKVIDNIYTSDDFYMLDEEYDIVKAKLDLETMYDGLKHDFSQEEDMLREEQVYTLLSDTNLIKKKK